MDPASLPVEWGNYLSILGFLILGVLVWLVPRALIYTGAENAARWRDIRVWASVLIVLQLTLYLVFA